MEKDPLTKYYSLIFPADQNYSWLINIRDPVIEDTF